MNRRVSEVLQSYYWPQNAIIIVLECDHRHIRPANWKVSGGDDFDCCFCDDDKTVTKMEQEDGWENGQ